MKQDPRPETLAADELLIDLLEGELSPSLEKDLSLLLLNSRPDGERMAELENLRELIKGSDDVPLPEDGRTYQRLHDGIMAAIDGRRPRKRPGSRPLSRVSPRQLGFPALVGTSAVTVLVSGLTLISSRSPQPGAPVGRSSSGSSEEKAESPTPGARTSPPKPAKPRPVKESRRPREPLSVVRAAPATAPSSSHEKR